MSDLFRFPHELLPFQVESIARDFVKVANGGGMLICWSTGCIYGDAEIVVNRSGIGRTFTLRDVVKKFNGESVHPGGGAKRSYSWDTATPTYVQREAEDGTVRLARLLNAWNSGVKMTYTVTTDTGRSIRATDEHPFLTERGWLRLDELIEGDLVHVRRHADEGKTAQVLYMVTTERVVSVLPYGKEETYDIEVADDPHNFIANGFVVHNTGKSVFGLRMSTLLAEEDLPYDHTVVLAEKGKLGEWVEDFTKYTGQSVRKHHGPNRLKKLAADGLPDVLVTTYETARLDLVQSVKGGRVVGSGPLYEALRGKSVLWIGDEFAAKLSNRSTAVYKAFDWVFKQQRKVNPTGHRVFGLTATPVETGYENAFNQGRLLFPDRMPTVKEFEESMVTYRDPRFGTPTFNQSYAPIFVERFAPMMDRRRKTDPDIVAQFPKRVEQVAHVDMEKRQADLYEAVISVADDMMAESGKDDVPGLFTALRMIAGHPASLPLAAKTGESNLVKMLVDVWGEQVFLDAGSAKEKELLIRLGHIIDEGEKSVVFTRFGNTILLVLQASMEAEGMRVFTNTGSMSAAESSFSQKRFRSHKGPAIFLTSDAGARGINLPEATNVFEYESATTFGTHVQRLDRIHRINSTAPSVFCTTMVLNETVEVPLLERMLDRNEQSDTLLGDTESVEGDMTAQERRKMFMTGIRKRKRAS